MAADALGDTLRAPAHRIDLYTLHTPDVIDVSGLLDESIQTRYQD